MTQNNQNHFQHMKLAVLEQATSTHRKPKIYQIKKKKKKEGSLLS